eukprot:TRINITY_DN779864_c0_g1_i1.p1 TRINITY_DN779864_c0_g1~~TRINITY_DN779864_c0_g1_i1.p1  ORF type:complete len:172 (+),score=35.87 TRINITY_DN779864_c0_g1_i1:115-630(+)
MEFCVGPKQSFQLVGFCMRYTQKDNAHFESIPKFWAEINSNGKREELEKYMNHLGMLAICFPVDGCEDEFDYCVGVSGVDTIPGYEDEVKSFTVPASTWVMFPGCGVIGEASGALWGRVFSEFFPTHPGIVHDKTKPSGERFPLDCHMKDGTMKFEIWVPVVGDNITVADK